MKHPQYKFNETFIHKNITVTHFTSIYPQDLRRNSLHFTNPFTSQITSLHFTNPFTSLLTSLAVTDDWTNSLYIIIIVTTNCRF